MNSPEETTKQEASSFSLIRPFFVPVNKTKKTGGKVPHDGKSTFGNYFLTFFCLEIRNEVKRNDDHQGAISSPSSYGDFEP